MIVIVLSLLLIALCIIIHYEALRLTSLGANDLKVGPRRRLWMMLSAAIFSHIIHVAFFAVGFLLVDDVFAIGSLEGGETGSFRDAFYFSITSYTTLGIGDIYPTGYARILSGVEALAGLVMVTWTASMTYLHMERFWHIDDGSDGRK